jgi:signal transduction histidine kinase
MYKGNFAKSEEYINIALEKALEYDYAEEVKKCYNLLSELYIARHDFRTHRLYGQKGDSIGNELVSDKTRLYAKEMAAKYETEKKQLEIDRQQSVIARQEMQRWFWAAGVASCVVFVVLLWYMLRLRIRRNRALTDLNTALASSADALGERNDALAETNATKDKFFKIISHDLKNPAVMQRDAIRVLFEHGAGWDAASLNAYYSELLHSADNQVELLYNILGWAQLQTGSMDCRPELFNLATTLRSDLGLLQKMAADKGVTLETSIPVEAVVKADSGMIAVVVRNLMTNAVKFTARGGTVRLAVVGELSRTMVGELSRTITPAADTTTAAPVEPQLPRYTVTISDTGVGMTDEEINNIFRLDRRTSQQGTAGETGTGLGLTVCRDLLKKHDSTLRIVSEKGKGSAFSFELSSV